MGEARRKDRAPQAGGSLVGGVPGAAGSGCPQPRICGGAPSLLPGAHTLGGHGLAHPEDPFLHRGLHHGSLQLLFSRQVSRDGAADLRGCLFLDGPQSSLGTEKGLRGPPGQEGRTDCFPHSLLIPATRASLKAQACSFLPRGSSSSLWDHPSPNGSQGVFFRPHRGFIPAQASRLENPLTAHGLHTHDLF